jgi:catechol 1,2-dioxygenase
MLLAGSLDVSSLVCLLNNGDNGNRDGTLVARPFWRLNSPLTENGGSVVRSDTPGYPAFITARVVDQASRSIADQFAK